MPQEGNDNHGNQCLETLSKISKQQQLNSQTDELLQFICKTTPSDIAPAVLGIERVYGNWMQRGYNISENWVGRPDVYVCFQFGAQFLGHCRVLCPEEQLLMDAKI